MNMKAAVVGEFGKPPMYEDFREPVAGAEVATTQPSNL
jgi:hypothetical protein